MIITENQNLNLYKNKFFDKYKNIFLIIMIKFKLFILMGLF